MVYRSQITKFTSYYNGKDGTSVNILGSYETYDALKAEHPTGAPGESYIIGEDLYVWSTTNNDWVNVGRIQGPQGATGPSGLTGATGAKGATGAQGKDGAPTLPAKTSENIRVFLLNNSPSQPNKPSNNSLGSWTTIELDADPTDNYVWTCTGNKVTTYAWGNPNSPSLDNIITTITYEFWTTPELWGAYGSDNIDQKTYATFLKLMNGKPGGLAYDEKGNLYVKAELVYANNILVKDKSGQIVLSATSGNSDTPVILAGWNVSNGGLTYGTAGNSKFTGLYTGTSASITINSYTGTDWRFVIGTTFGVTQSGAMYATSGTIGGWKINASTLTSGDVTLYSSTSPYLAVGGSESSNWRIKAGTTFGVTNGGHMACTNGRIGGWVIGSSGITYGTSGGSTFAGLYTGESPSTTIGSHTGKDWRFILGTKFGVTTEGALYASAATISGTIYANAGTIGTDLSKGLIAIDSSLNINGDDGSSGSTKETYFSFGIPSTVYPTIGVGAYKSHFYLGSGGLILRNPAKTFPYQSGNGVRYGGVRITYTSIYLSGNSNSTTPASCFSSMTGNGIKFGYIAREKPTVNGGGTSAETDVIVPQSGVTSYVEYFLTGQVKSNSRFDWFADRGKTIYHHVSNQGKFWIQGAGSNNSAIYIQDAGIVIGSTSDSVTTRGTWTGKWTSTSDRRLKNSISAYDHRYELFFDALKPCRFKFNEPSNNIFAYNTGFIAQDVEEAMYKAGLTDDDWAGLITMNKETEEEKLVLYYSDFIALNTWQIQLLKPRMSAVEQEITQLKLEIQQLRTELQNLKNS